MNEASTIPPLFSSTLAPTTGNPVAASVMIPEMAPRGVVTQPPEVASLKVLPAQQKPSSVSMFRSWPAHRQCVKSLLSLIPALIWKPCWQVGGEEQVVEQGELPAAVLHSV